MQRLPWVATIRANPYVPQSCAQGCSSKLVASHTSSCGTMHHTGNLDFQHQACAAAPRNLAAAACQGQAALKTLI